MELRWTPNTASVWNADLLYKESFQYNRPARASFGTRAGSLVKGLLVIGLYDSQINPFNIFAVSFVPSIVCVSKRFQLVSDRVRAGFACGKFSAAANWALTERPYRKWERFCPGLSPLSNAKRTRTDNKKNENR